MSGGISSISKWIFRLEKPGNCCHFTERRHVMIDFLNSSSDWDDIKVRLSLRKHSGTLDLFVADDVRGINRISKTRIREKRKQKYFRSCEDILPAESPLQR